jgi:hypothetical protein
MFYAFSHLNDTSGPLLPPPLTNQKKYEILFQSPRSVLNPPGCFVLVNPEKLVQQITLAMHHLFQQIPILEFVNSPKYGDPLRCPNIARLKNFKKQVTLSSLSLSVCLLTYPLDPISPSFSPLSDTLSSSPIWSMRSSDTH